MQNKCPFFWIHYIFNVTLHLEMKYNTYTLDNGLRIIHLPRIARWCIAAIR